MRSNKEALRIARQLLRESMVEGKIDADLVRAKLRAISQQKPRGYIAIAEAYGRLVRLELSKRHAVVESAVELDSSMKDRVQNDLKRKYGDDLTFEFATNPKLIGGMRVRVGSDVWDGSVQGRIQELQETFK